MTTSFQTRVDAELIRHLYTQLPVSQTASAGALVAVIIGVQHQASTSFLVTWATLHVVVMLGRLLLMFAFRKHEPISAEDMRWWDNRFVFGAFVAGVLWGWAGYNLMGAASLPGQLLVMFAVGGILAGASQSLSSWMKAYIAFCLPLTLPPSLWLFTQSQTHYHIMCLLMVLFVLASFSLARKSGRSLSDAHRLHFENKTLVDKLGVEVNIRKISEARLTDYNEVLSKLARQHPYENVLKAINLMLERHIPGCKSSIMTLDEGGKWLQMASAPNLPAPYSQAINRIPAEQGVGSCGTAVSSNQPVTSMDIKTDPLWLDYKDIANLALAHDLMACTSFPIQNLEGAAIGTFAVYHAQPHALSEDETACLSSAAYLAGVVLERKRNEEKLDYLAHYDDLTSLANRTLFTDRLQQALAWAKRDKKKFALLFMDLDKFKIINDERGHAVGDLVLKEVAKRLRQCVRDVDTAARMGGDEFTVLITDVHDAKAPALVANKIISLLSTPMEIEGTEYSVGVSVGISLYPEDSHDADELIVMADAAMYQAKGLGGNLLVFHQLPPVTKTTTLAE